MCDCAAGEEAVQVKKTKTIVSSSQTGVQRVRYVSVLLHVYLLGAHHGCSISTESSWMPFTLRRIVPRFSLCNILLLSGNRTYVTTSRETNNMT